MCHKSDLSALLFHCVLQGQCKQLYLFPSVEEVEAEEALFQTFRGILKNLTQQKFEICAEQALSMRIDSEEQLAGCADIMLTMVRVFLQHS